MKFFTLVRRYIFSEELPLEGRILNLALSFGILAAFITALVQIAEKSTFFSVAAVFGMILSAGVLLIAANKFKIYKIAARIAVIAVCLVLMPLLFFTNAGIDSGMAAYFVMSVVLIFVVLEGTECVIMAVLNLAIITGCYTLDRLRPDLIIGFRFELQRYIDNVQTIFIASVFIGLVIKFQTMIYKTEKAKADAAAKAKTDFLANVSHEIRTPLNAIIGLGELELRKEHDAETQKNLEKMFDSGRILLSIINDLLDVSKIESGKFELVPVEYSTPSVINDTVSTNIVRIGSKPINFILKVDASLPQTLFGDELRLRQILNNLLSNAFKYTKAGSVTLEIQSRLRPGGDVTELLMSVRDTGIGIKKEDLARLFSVYNQVDTKSNRSIEGTGLGLSICKSLTEMMGGQISVDSEYGTGSVFSVIIPQKIINPAPIGEGVAENLERFQFVNVRRDRRKQQRIELSYARALIVDDVEINLDVAAGMLMAYNMECDCVLSGPEAIKRIKEEKIRYDVIFMDHMMPGMDGIEAVKHIREIETGYAKNIPIIALTANAIVGNDVMFLNNGFQAFLSKPIDTAKLDQLLNIWVRNREKEKEQITIGNL